MTGKNKWSHQTDETLIALLARDQMEPLGELYRRYGAMVKEALVRFAPELSVAEAEELGQDVFLVLAKTAKRYREQMKFKAWLYGIAVKKAGTWRKTTWLRRALLEKSTGQYVGIAPQRHTGYDHELEMRDTLTSAMSTLSTGQREVLVLHAIEGFTGEEIAQILGVKPKTVWTRLHRARKNMVMSLKQEADYPQLCKGEA